MNPTAAEPYQSTAVYQRLLGYARPHWRVFLLALVAMVTFAATETAVIRLIKPLTDGIFVDKDPEMIRIIPLVILGIFMVRGVASFASAYALAWIGQQVVSRIRCQVFEHLLAVPIGYHDRSRNTDLQTKLTYHASVISDSSTSVLTSVVKDGLTAVGLIAMMFYTSWKLTLYALVIAPLVSLSITWVNRRFRSLAGRVQSSIGGINHIADEAITGRRIVKIYGGERFAMAQFAQMDHWLRRLTLKVTAAGAANNGALELIAAIGVSLLVFLATQPATLATMTPGTFVSFIGAMLALRAPLQAMTGISERLQRGIVAGADLFSFLDTPVEQDPGSRPLTRAVGALRFEQLRFAYSAEARPALDGVTLDLAAGKTYAFVGKSGSGKSTLLALIPRFYEPGEGRLLLDGHDLRDYALKDLRRQIALVDQNVVLFHASIAENIAYGSPEVTRAAIETAARRAHAWEFIQSLPQGLDTPVGQDGGMLSGGQRQRIAIARALLKDAPILILDEATSALDTESERAVQQALEELKKGRTTLVIAHRLSTIQNADRIVVMHEGRVAEQGSHAELIAQDGAYAALHRLQFREPNAEAVSIDSPLSPSAGSVTLPLPPSAGEG